MKLVRETVRQVGKIRSIRWQKYSRCNKRPREEKNGVERAGVRVIGNEVKEIRKSQIMRADGMW